MNLIEVDQDQTELEMFGDCYVFADSYNENYDNVSDFVQACSMFGACGVKIIHNFVNDSNYKEVITMLDKKTFDGHGNDTPGLVLATTTATDRGKNNLFRKSGWIKYTEFINPKTGNKCCLWGKIL